MSDKAARQRKLREIVERRPVANQQQLVKLLKQAGFAVTQASISRDIRELGLVKVDGAYCVADDLVGRRTAAPARLHKGELITRHEPIGANFIVVKTIAGAASAVAVDLDELGQRDIAGTVAGDDTIFVVLRSRTAQGRVLALLRSLAPKPPRP